MARAHLGDAGRVGQRQVAPVAQRDGGADLELAAAVQGEDRVESWSGVVRGSVRRPASGWLGGHQGPTPQSWMRTHGGQSLPRGAAPAVEPIRRTVTGRGPRGGAATSWPGIVRNGCRRALVEIRVRPRCRCQHTATRSAIRTLAWSQATAGPVRMARCAVTLTTSHRRMRDRPSRPASHGRRSRGRRRCGRRSAAAAGMRRSCPGRAARPARQPGTPAAASTPALARCCPKSIQGKGSSWSAPTRPTRRRVPRHRRQDGQGFDVDLVNAVAQKLGVKFEFVNGAVRQDHRSASTAGKYDIGVSSFTDQRRTARRRSTWSATSPPAPSGGREGQPEGHRPGRRLCGTEVAVQKGTVQVDDITAQAARRARTTGKPAISIDVRRPEPRPDRGCGRGARTTPCWPTPRSSPTR